MRRLFIMLTLSLGLLSIARAETVYSFGVVPQFEPRKLAAIWSPILADLERRTGFRLELVGAPRIPEFEQEFQQGHYDFAYMNPYHSLIAIRTQHYVPLVRDGGRELYGILVVAKDGPIKKLSDLKGRDVAFPSPNALGAALLIRADLDRLKKIPINPIWAQTHTSAYLNVALGKAAAAGGVMSTLEQQPAEVRDKLTILYETRHVAPHPVMAHPRVPAADREKLRQAFLDMAATPEGAAMLANIPIKQVTSAQVSDYKKIGHMRLEKYYVKDSD